MFKVFEFISEPYEVVRTVGFRYSGLNGMHEHGFFDMRLDIVKYAEAGSFAPLLWEVNPMSRSLHPSAVHLPVDLGLATVEETITATLEYLNSRGGAPSPVLNQKPVPAKGE